jgi:predicted nucleic acid-binding protein
MATVNFSVPDDVKDAFNKAFKGENKSAILARLMRDAVEERKRQKRRTTAINAILRLHAKSIAVSDSIDLIQPPHWMAEVTAVLARLQPDLSDDAIDLLDAMEIPTRAESSVYQLASHLATELNHHLFDTLYHALALQENATLITADHHYFKKSINHGSICMLADFDIET